MQLAWGGILLNPILFGVTIWLVVLILQFVVFFGKRKCRRISRNECVKCGYPRGASERCSECGYKFESPLLKTPPTSS